MDGRINTTLWRRQILYPDWLEEKGCDIHLIAFSFSLTHLFLIQVHYSDELGGAPSNRMEKEVETKTKVKKKIIKIQLGLV